ncbi:MAG: recombinase family protein [Lachnospiraceae bacterium]|nr:recombinase family protein [Lachnospiraceae bacterium]
MATATIKKKVAMIPAAPQMDKSLKMTERQLRVAAYCRVSTELESQEGSYEAQVEYYTEKITENPNWKMAGIYADDGKSATNTKKRADFRAMIQDALDGKIDLIITKSVSRFARNTVDSLTTIRKLKEHNVAVVFEKEGVNTLDGTGEFLITILSSIAQEESRNISENTRWGVVRRFENGQVIVNHSKFMGYTKNKEGTLIIVPEEAEIVKMIFRLYLEGYSCGKIKKHLEELGIKTTTGKEIWRETVIDKMLRNEKYMGDALLQKTYTVDFMTKKKVINKGIVPQYYVEDDHEAIIPKELFYRVQEEIMRRASMCKSAVTRKKNQRSKYSSTYALTGIVLCGDCGWEYRRVTWSKKGKKKVVWRCTNRLENGTKHCKNAPTIEEKALHKAVMDAINQIMGTTGEKEFVDTFRQNVIHVMGSYAKNKEQDSYDEKIRKLQAEMTSLIDKNAKQKCSLEKFETAYKQIAEQIDTQRKEQLESQRKKKLADSSQERIRDMDAYIQKATHKVTEFDNDLVRRLIKTVKIVSADKLMVQFQSGIYLEQTINYD